jgi:hypothetical protein
MYPAEVVLCWPVNKGAKMKRVSVSLLGLVMLVAFSTMAAKAPESAQQTLYKLVEHLTKQDLAAAAKLSLSGAEYASISSRKIDSADYQKRIDDFLKQLASDLKSGLKMKKAETTDALIIPAGHKTKQEIVMAVIYATFEIHGKALESPVPFFFVNHKGKWKMIQRR